MFIKICLIIFLMFSVAACAGNRTTSGQNSQTEYLEVSNPGFTLSRDAPATIWVPKSSLENGLPRGNKAIKSGYESLTSSHSQNSPAATEANYVATIMTRSLPTGVRNRVAVLDTGQNHLAITFKEKLRSLKDSPIIAIAPEESSEKLRSKDERATYAVKAWQESGVNVSMFVAVPAELTSSSYLSVEMYDGLGAGLISSVDSEIPMYDAKDPTGLNRAVAASLALLAERVRNEIVLLPWYGKIVAIEAGNIYINGGHEAGISMGQRLKVYRGGKVVHGLGFAPGTCVGLLEISGFVGSNGATAIAKDGIQVYPSDIIAVQ